MLSKKNYLFILFLLFLISFSYSCNKNKPPANDAVAATLYDYSGLDGCSWVIKLEDGEVLEPSNLGEFDIKINEGEKVWVKYSLAENQISICMVGPQVDIMLMWER